MAGYFPSSSFYTMGVKAPGLSQLRVYGRNSPEVQVSSHLPTQGWAWTLTSFSQESEEYPWLKDLWAFAYVLPSA